MFFAPIPPVAFGMIGSAIAWVGTALLQAVRPGKRITGDTYAEWRLKFWNSKLGKMFEKIARFGLKPRAVPAELTHRPTELAIGIAADSLFESLPKEQRKELKELPSVLSRLQADAAAMRETVDSLSQALAQLGDATAGRPDIEKDKLRGELIKQRDEAAARMAAAVSALESLRLNLLRLKAGMGSVGELTADLGAARALADTMHYATEGNAEVARLLKRQRTPTPPGPLVPSHG
jgi:serine/threonine-protein kinase